jgi:hypothetical protein
MLRTSLVLLAITLVGCTRLGFGVDSAVVNDHGGSADGPTLDRARDQAADKKTTLLDVSQLDVKKPDLAKKVDLKKVDLEKTDGKKTDTGKPDLNKCPGGCNDNLTCTTDLCTQTGCTNTVNAGTCLIGGVCYNSGDTKPGNTCKKCSPDMSTGWSNDDGKACNDGLACTTNDTCSGGACAGTAYTCSPTPCTVVSCDGKGGCITTPKVCSDGDVCTVDTCTSATGCAFSGYEVGPCLDQSFVDSSTNLGANINEAARYVAQVFTAGKSGTLAGVNISVGSGQSYGLRVTIRNATGGVPGSTVLGQTTLGGASAALSMVITFASPIPIVSGSSYAIVVDYPSAPPQGAGQGVGIWTGNYSSSYAGGSFGFSVSDGVTWSMDPSGRDLFFRTYVK